MWDLPGPGIKPVSPALAGGFLTTAPPGKPYLSIFKEKENFPSLATVGAQGLGAATLAVQFHVSQVPSIRRACFGKQLNFCICAILRTSVKPLIKALASFHFQPD